MLRNRRNHDGRTRAVLRLRATIAVCVVAVLLAACTSSLGAAPADPRANPFSTASFAVRANPYTFGQDPFWTTDGRVLSNEKDSSGTEQVYVSHLNGTAIRCLTCGQPGPNGFPQERAQGDWILFCSWRGQTSTFGAPCLGGIGSDLYVMRPDGTHVTRLTLPGGANEPAGVPYDNYHPYWSPDGREIAWTHVEYRDRSHGGTQWTMLTARFDPRPSRAPQLTRVVVVGPAGDHAYETQAWAPNGSGFLYTSLSSAGDRKTGWLNSELFFLRLRGGGASRQHPTAVHVTDGHPGWDEQAVFTPDAKNVIWMSSRGSPTWYQTVVTAAQQARYEPPFENDVAGPMFVLTVLDRSFHTDLYELDRSTHAIRRLTFQNRVVPEFSFDPQGTKLLWTTGDHSHTFIGTFGISSRRRASTRPTTDARWKDAPRHGKRLAPAPTAAMTTPAFKPANLPTVVTDGLVLLEAQLTELSRRLQDLPRGGSCCRPASG